MKKRIIFLLLSVSILILFITYLFKALAYTTIPQQKLKIICAESKKSIENAIALYGYSQNSIGSPGGPIYYDSKKIHKYSDVKGMITFKSKNVFNIYFIKWLKNFNRVIYYPGYLADHQNITPKGVKETLTSELKILNNLQVIQLKPVEHILKINDKFEAYQIFSIHLSDDFWKSINYKTNNVKIVNIKKRYKNIFDKLYLKFKMNDFLNQQSDHFKNNWKDMKLKNTYQNILKEIHKINEL